VDITNIPPTPEQILELKARRGLDETALRTIFLEARTANGFLDAPIPRELLERAVELAELGPTSAHHAAGPLRLRRIARGEGEAQTRPLGRQPRKDDARAGHGDRRRGPAIL
jgi:nitroreductase